jgi:hypothetical protein
VGHHLSSFVLLSNAPFKGPCLFGFLLHLAFTPSQYAEAPPTTTPIGSPPSLAICYMHQPLHVQHNFSCVAFFLERLSLKMKAPRSFEMSGTTRPMTQHHIPEDSKLEYHRSSIFYKSCVFKRCNYSISWCYFTPVKGR